MSIADKLVTIAENQEKVFDAGGLHYSPKGTASGEVVSISDISPIEHNLRVKLSTDVITDFSTVKLDALGKNLFNNDTNLIKRVDYTLASGATAQRIGYEVYLPIGTYKISATPLQEFSEIYLYGAIVNVNGVCRQEAIKIVANKATSYRPTITIENGEKFVIYDALGVGNTERTKQYFAMFNIQIEFGESATEFEEYKEPTTYTPNADGTVEGVKSIYPTTTLVPSEQGVLVECEYYQDARKVKQDLTDLIISLGGLLDV